MLLQLSRAHFPVTTLGPGQRIGIWFQGCSIRCAGCVSTDTWKADSSKGLDILSLMDWCKSAAPEGPDGVTITGGEPFDQPEALGSLLDYLDQWRKNLDREFDILCYSGYPLRRLLLKYQSILPKLDALIPEPFLAKQVPGKLWRGSSNQRIVPLSSLGLARYGDKTELPGKPEFQVVVQGRQIWLVGIPGNGTMDEFHAQCQTLGLQLLETSWSP